MLRKGSYTIGERFVPTKPDFSCRVLLMDGSDVVVDLGKKALGQVVFDQVLRKLEILERDYFGLLLREGNNRPIWMDLVKPVKKQIKKSSKVYFRVKFYPADPIACHGKARNQFYLQLKVDIAEGRLLCPPNTAPSFYSLILQADTGDYESDERDSEHLREHHLLVLQSKGLVEEIIMFHKYHRGMNPQEAVNRFLKKAREIESYGMRFTDVKSEGDDVLYQLGLCPFGIALNRNTRLLNLYKWSRIAQVSYKGKQLTLRIKEGHGMDEGRYIPVQLYLDTVPLCEELWQDCIEHLNFFSIPQHSLKSPPDSEADASSSPEGTPSHTASVIHPIMPSHMTSGFLHKHASTHHVLEQPELLSEEEERRRKRVRKVQSFPKKLPSEDPILAALMSKRIHRDGRHAIDASPPLSPDDDLYQPEEPFPVGVSSRASGVFIRVSEEREVSDGAHRGGREEGDGSDDSAACNHAQEGVGPKLNTVQRGVPPEPMKPATQEKIDDGEEEEEEVEEQRKESGVPFERFRRDRKSYMKAVRRAPVVPDERVKQVVMDAANHRHKVDEKKANRNLVRHWVQDHQSSKPTDVPGDQDTGRLATPGPSGATLGPSGATPGPSGATPGPSGATPGPSGATLGPSGAAPGPSGATPGPSGATLGPSGATPGPSGAALGPSGATLGPSGAALGQSGATLGPSVATLGPSVTLPNHLSVQPGTSQGNTITNHSKSDSMSTPDSLSLRPASSRVSSANSDRASSRGQRPSSASTPRGQRPSSASTSRGQRSPSAHTNLTDTTSNSAPYDANRRTSQGLLIGEQLEGGGSDHLYEHLPTSPHHTSPSTFGKQKGLGTGTSATLGPSVTLPNHLSVQPGTSQGNTIPNHSKSDSMSTPDSLSLRPASSRVSSANSDRASSRGQRPSSASTPRGQRPSSASTSRGQMSPSSHTNFSDTTSNSAPYDANRRTSQGLLIGEQLDGGGADHLYEHLPTSPHHTSLGVTNVEASVAEGSHRTSTTHLLNEIDQMLWTLQANGEGNRRESAEGNRRESAEGNRRESADGNRRESAEKGTVASKQYAGPNNVEDSIYDRLVPVSSLTTHSGPSLPLSPPQTLLASCQLPTAPISQALQPMPGTQTRLAPAPQSTQSLPTAQTSTPPLLLSHIPPPWQALPVTSWAPPQPVTSWAPPQPVTSWAPPQPVSQITQPTSYVLPAPQTSASHTLVTSTSSQGNVPHSSSQALRQPPVSQTLIPSPSSQSLAQSSSSQALRPPSVSQTLIPSPSSQSLAQSSSSQALRPPSVSQTLIPSPSSQSLAQSSSSQALRPPSVSQTLIPSPSSQSLAQSSSSQALRQPPVSQTLIPSPSLQSLAQSSSPQIPPSQSLVPSSSSETPTASQEVPLQWNQLPSSASQTQLASQANISRTSSAQSNSQAHGGDATRENPKTMKGPSISWNTLVREAMVADDLPPPPPHLLAFSQELASQDSRSMSSAQNRPLSEQPAARDMNPSLLPSTGQLDPAFSVSKSKSAASVAPQYPPEIASFMTRVKGQTVDAKERGSPDLNAGLRPSASPSSLRRYKSARGPYTQAEILNNRRDVHGKLSPVKEQRFFNRGEKETQGRLQDIFESFDSLFTSKLTLQSPEKPAESSANIEVTQIITSEENHHPRPVISSVTTGTIVPEPEQTKSFQDLLKTLPDTKKSGKARVLDWMESSSDVWTYDTRFPMLKDKDTGNPIQQYQRPSHLYEDPAQVLQGGLGNTFFVDV